MLKPPPKNSRENIKKLLINLQEKICIGLEELDGKSKFNEESWERPEGGGGKSRVLKNGHIFEQAGVNFSEVTHCKSLAIAHHSPSRTDKQLQEHSNNLKSDKVFFAYQGLSHKL